ncbi:MAG TPA: TerB family tellurite resistance protein, partial [Niastella sp.]|nr:TerB family tellurite resistance protein [Niastella sp.]
FFHCCFKDGTVTEGEIKAVSEKLVAAGLNKALNFTDEVVRYKAYRKEITNEASYIKDLVSVINPVNSLALYASCLELCLSDGLLQTEEEQFLQILADALQLETSEAATCKKLMIQRKVVESEKVY